MKSEVREEENNIEQRVTNILAKNEKEKEKDFVNLVAQIILDITFKQAYEKGNQIPEIQQRRSKPA